MFNPFKFIRNLFTRPAAVAPVDPFAGLMAKFNEASGSVAKWDVPFPMAVFGTLRANQGNHPLMGLPVGQESQGEVRNAWGRPLSDARYGRVMKAVLPNFAADGIHLVAWPGKCVFFEVYVYDTENFTKVLPRIDGLEGFRPGDADRSWYFRTLVNLRVLPDDFPTPERLGAVLDLPADVESLAIVPAWIYSSKQENERSLAVPGTPITWAGATVPPPPEVIDEDEEEFDDEDEDDYWVDDDDDDWDEDDEDDNWGDDDDWDEEDEDDDWEDDDEDEEEEEAEANEAKPSVKNP